MAKTPTWQLPYPDLASPADIQGVDGVDDLAIRVDACLTQLRASGAIPGEMKLWPGGALPAQATYGHWVWADGAAYDSATYPLASAAISPNWKTFGGQADPGAGKFRVPDMRGVLPAGMDAMPGGARANRVTRAAAATLAGLTGTEYVALTAATMPAHAHGVNTGNESVGHTHSGTTNSENTNHSHSGSTGTDSTDHVHITTTPFGGSNTSTAGGGVGVPDTTARNNQSGGVNTYHSHAFTSGTVSAFHQHTFATGDRSSAHTHAIASEGGGGAHDNMPPTVFVPYIVKLDD